MSPSLTLSPRAIFIGRLIKRHQSLLGGGFSYRQRRDFVTLTRTPLCPFPPPFAAHEYVYGLVGRGWDPGDRSKLAKTISVLSLALSLFFFLLLSPLYDSGCTRLPRIILSTVVVYIIWRHYSRPGYNPKNDSCFACFKSCDGSF